MKKRLLKSWKNKKNQKLKKRMLLFQILNLRDQKNHRKKIKINE